MVQGRVHSIETMGALDGPGIRVVVFLAGCPLRCRYCHNPDSWDKDSGELMTAAAVAAKIKRYQPYFGGDGGVTLSGGEPLGQPQFAGEILRLCHEAGISTCVDTSGSIINEKVKAALAYADLVLLDVKHTDAEKYRGLTGGDLARNRAFLAHCKEAGIPLWIRQVIVPGWSDTEDDIKALLSYVEGANVQRIELLPYHTMGVYKWDALKIPYPLAGVEPPSPERMDRLRELIPKKNRAN